MKRKMKISSESKKFKKRKKFSEEKVLKINPRRSDQVTQFSHTQRWIKWIPSGEMRLIDWRND